MRKEIGAMGYLPVTFEVDEYNDAVTLNFRDELTDTERRKVIARLTNRFGSNISCHWPGDGHAQLLVTPMGGSADLESITQAIRGAFRPPVRLWSSYLPYLAPRPCSSRAQVGRKRKQRNNRIPINSSRN